jgi:hypothetical protein
MYNRELESASIWNTSKANFKTDKIDYYIDRLDFLIMGPETTKHLAFLTQILSKILGHNSKYEWGIVKGVVIYGNYKLVYFYLLSYYFNNY